MTSSVLTSRSYGRWHGRSDRRTRVARCVHAGPNTEGFRRMGHQPLYHGGDCFSLEHQQTTPDEEYTSGIPRDAYNLLLFYIRKKYIYTYFWESYEQYTLPQLQRTMYILNPPCRRRHYYTKLHTAITSSFSNFCCLQSLKCICD